MRTSVFDVVLWGAICLSVCIVCILCAIMVIIDQWACTIYNPGLSCADCLSHMFSVVAKKLGSDEGFIWFQRPASTHSTRRIRAHYK